MKIKFIRFETCLRQIIHLAQPSMLWIVQFSITKRLFSQHSQVNGNQLPPESYSTFRNRPSFNMNTVHMIAVNGCTTQKMSYGCSVMVSILFFYIFQPNQVMKVEKV